MDDADDHLERWLTDKGSPEGDDHDPRALAQSEQHKVMEPTRKQKDRIRQRKAMELRMSGNFSWEEIAKRSGYASGASAQRAVSRAMDRLPVVPGVEVHRTMQLARAEHMLSLVWPVMERGDLGAIQKALNILAYMDRVVEGRELAPGPKGWTGGGSQGTSSEGSGMLFSDDDLDIVDGEVVDE